MKSPEELAAIEIFRHWKHREDFYNLIDRLGFEIANEQSIDFKKLIQIPGMSERTIGEKVIYTILIKILETGKFDCNDEI